MTGKIQGSSGLPPDQHRDNRTDLPAKTSAIRKGAGGGVVEGGVMDRSGGGAGLFTDIPFENNSFVVLHIDGMEPIAGRVARKFIEGMGVEFDLSDPAKKDVEEEIRKFRLTVAREKS